MGSYQFTVKLPEALGEKIERIKVHSFNGNRNALAKEAFERLVASYDTVQEVQERASPAPPDPKLVEAAVTADYIKNVLLANIFETPLKKEIDRLCQLLNN